MSKSNPINHFKKYTKKLENLIILIDYEEQKLLNQQYSLLTKSKISLTKDILPLVIPLVIILNFGNDQNDFILMLDNIAKNPKLLKIFNDESIKWWGVNDLLNIIMNYLRVMEPPRHFSFEESTSLTFGESPTKKRKTF